MTQPRLAGRLGLTPKALVDMLYPHPQHQLSTLLLQPRLLRPRHPHPTILRPSHAYTTASEGPLPRVARPSLWVSLIPKFLRQKPPKDPTQPAKSKSKEWNPATFYIVIFLLIGSQAIQMIALRNQFTDFSRRADTRIGLLKEAIERVQKGEDVDVKALLGTGDKAAEKEWEEVVHELSQENTRWQETKNKPASQPQPKKQPTPTSTAAETQPSKASRGETTSTNKAPRGFY
ncbi:MAG: hypothetical protein M1839_001324 [Geoglossum umbratile]|nr:MAG: hypothetical protein M1839_001324 [Geoglossum umbratile]